MVLKVSVIGWVEEKLFRLVWRDSLLDHPLADFELGLLGADGVLQGSLGVTLNMQVGATVQLKIMVEEYSSGGEDGCWPYVFEEDGGGG
jgi:hypothetical protein